MVKKSRLSIALLFMNRMPKKKYYAYIIPHEGKSGITREWQECERIVSGKSSARFKTFRTEEDARRWLADGGEYRSRAELRMSLPPGIYFDAGTGRGLGYVEINVTDEKGGSLLDSVVPAIKISRYDTHVITRKGATNNYGELLACKYALEIALGRRISKVYGDSALVINHWSKGIMKEKKLPLSTRTLVKTVGRLRSQFEENGGSVIRISGDINPADLGFHR